MRKIKTLVHASAGFLLMLLVSCTGCSLPFAEKSPPHSLSILSYNVQNLFDDHANGNEYYEFDPSRGEWTTELYHRKLLALSELILHTPRGGADVLVLQEVENLQTVEELRDLYLKGAGYRFIRVSDTPDQAIQLACLSKYPIEWCRYHHLQRSLDIELRPIMECSIDVEGEPLALLINHWKSKYGGAEETEPLRMASARLVQRIAEEQRRARPGQELIILGDLNERSDEYYQIEAAYPTALMPHDLRETYRDELETGELDALFLSGNREDADGVRSFFSPWLAGEANLSGSYVYGGDWEPIDHVLFGPRLYDGKGFEYEAFRVVAPDFVLTEDGHPLSFSRRSGFGYSDHLPVLLELQLR